MAKGFFSEIMLFSDILYLTVSNAPVAATNIVMNGAGEKIAWKIIPRTTQPITAFNPRIIWGANSNQTNFKLGVFAHDWVNNMPDTATQLGGYTPEFAGGAGTTLFIGEKTFSVNSGALTVNEPIWIIMEYSSGTALDANHSAQATYVNASGFGTSATYWLTPIMRLWNAVNWSTNLLGAFSMILKYADGSVSGGSPFTENGTNPATDGYGTNRQGLKFRVGSDCYLSGCLARITKAGSPNNLLIKVYEENVLKDTITMTASKVQSTSYQRYQFPNTPLLRGGKDCYIILSQVSDGGTDAADYDLYSRELESADYKSAFVGANTSYVYGTGDTPSSLTLSSTTLPFLFPIVDAAETGLSRGQGAMRIKTGGTVYPVFDVKVSP